MKIIDPTVRNCGLAGRWIEVKNRSTDETTAYSFKSKNINLPFIGRGFPIGIDAHGCIKVDKIQAITGEQYDPMGLACN